MAQDFHDHAGIGALLVEEGRAGVAQVVEADLADAGADAQRLEGAVQVARLDRGSVPCGEDQALAVPFQLLPAPFRSAICWARWGLSAVTHSAGRATRRAERCVRAAGSQRQRSCPEFLYWIKAARLRRAARAGGHGPPPLHVSATAPAAPTRSSRNIAGADSQTGGQPNHSEHQDQADTHQARPRRPTVHRSMPHAPQSRSPSPVDKPRRQRPGRSGAQAVTYGSSVAGAGTGLLETHVTGDRSAHPPPWLAFGGSGQNPSSIRQHEAGFVAAPESEHANSPGTIGAGVLIRDSAPDHPERCPG